MHLSIVTPEETVVDREVTEVTAPGSVGEMGILTDHITFLGTLGTGAVRYKGPGGGGQLVVSGGVVEVRDNRITILADDAMEPADVDVAVAREDLAEAESAMSEADPYGEAHETAATARAWAQVRIEAAGKS
jgi:F-type H+-transporting ATPase subunit epsilon